VAACDSSDTWWMAMRRAAARSGEWVQHFSNASCFDIQEPIGWLWSKFCSPLWLRQALTYAAGRPRYITGCISRERKGEGIDIDALVAPIGSPVVFLQCQGLKPLQGHDPTEIRSNLPNSADTSIRSHAEWSRSIETETVCVPVYGHAGTYMYVYRRNDGQVEFTLISG